MDDPRQLDKETRKARRKRLTERLESHRERANLLELELRHYANDFFRVCIFGSARIQPDDEEYKTTEKLAYLLGQEGMDVLTGGGRGLMEAANKGVLDGRKAAGSRSRSFGLTIELNRFETPSEHLDIKYHHRRFSSRLDDFMRLSHAIVVTPGGIGTNLELFFAWQLLQLGHMPERPVILLGRSFWKGLLDWVENVQIARGLVSPGDMRWIFLVDSPEEAMPLILEEYKKFLERKTAQGA